MSLEFAAWFRFGGAAFFAVGSFILSMLLTLLALAASRSQRRYGSHGHSEDTLQCCYWKLGLLALPIIGFISVAYGQMAVLMDQGAYLRSDGVLGIYAIPLGSALLAGAVTIVVGSFLHKWAYLTWIAGCAVVFSYAVLAVATVSPHPHNWFWFGSAGAPFIVALVLVALTRRCAPHQACSLPGSLAVLLLVNAVLALPAFLALSPAFGDVMSYEALTWVLFGVDGAIGVMLLYLIHKLDLL